MGIDSLREQARRCRRLAAEVGDIRTRRSLTELAAEYDRRAYDLTSHMPAECPAMGAGRPAAATAAQELPCEGCPAVDTCHAAGAAAAC